MIEVCVSGYRGRSVLRTLQQSRPVTFCTEFICEDGSSYAGQLEAESWTEAELIARALGVKVVGILVSEVSITPEEFERIRETKDEK